MKRSKLELFKRFRKFHEDNPKVYELFTKFTFHVIKKGHNNFSADAIAHRIRWETTIETTDEEFKICNDHIAYYSRLFMAQFPEQDGFFRTKEIHPEVNDWLYSLAAEMSAARYYQPELL